VSQRDLLWPLEIDGEPTYAPIVKSSDEINSQPIDLDKILISKEKRTTPTEVANKLLELCHSDKIKNLFAFVEIKDEEFLLAAKKSTKRYEQNKSRSVIDGVPFFVKEHIKIANYKTYYGHGDNGEQSMTTAFCIQKLLDNGGMLVGTTTMPQFGSNAIGANPDVKFPSPIYPWDSTRYPGGSSSGNGVVVGMGLCPFSIGSDGLGSIRVPSGFNGIVGLRSTFSRISNEGCANDVDQNRCLVIGPMSSSVGDAAIVYSIISGPDSNFTFGLNQPSLVIPNFNNFDIKNIKFGFCPEYIENDINVIVGYMLGSTVTDDEIIKICKQRTRFMDIIKRIFENLDVILCLNSICIAPLKDPILDKNGFSDINMFKATTFYAFISSFTGVPSLCLNVGYEEETGLPISLQLLCKWWKEDLLLSVGKYLEDIFPLIKRPPIYDCPLPEFIKN
ncbi:hypothetical protein HZS_2067, partial [Henneguya salminicola]